MAGTDTQGTDEGRRRRRVELRQQQEGAVGRRRREDECESGSTDGDRRHNDHTRVSHRPPKSHSHTRGGWSLALAVQVLVAEDRQAIRLGDATNQRWQTKDKATPEQQRTHAHSEHSELTRSTAGPK